MPQRNETARDPGDVDFPVRLTSPRDWLVVLVVSAVVIGGAVWGATAELSRSVTAGGLITSPDGAFSVQSPVGGQVTDVLVSPGDRIERGARIAHVLADGVRTTVRSPADGQVFAVPARVGEVVEPGSVVIDAERGTAAQANVAVLFLPVSVPAELDVGAPVQLTVQSAPVNQFGVLRGKITSVDPVLSSRQEIADFVGDPDLATALAGTAGGRKVVVALDRSGTPSGYLWSTRTGPPFPIASRTVVLGNLPQPPARPIEWVVPR
jgi:multidrug efflux pump subunit AcrA (membrane-fusion protein)